VAKNCKRQRKCSPSECRAYNVPNEDRDKLWSKALYHFSPSISELRNLTPQLLLFGRDFVKESGSKIHNFNDFSLPENHWINIVYLL
jgi:hypothetical protein